MKQTNNGKCIIILSSKSSGSSALQYLLSKLGEINHVQYTRHYQNETLFWTKAASVLGLEQIDMLESEVPIGKIEAHNDLHDLLNMNLGEEKQYEFDRETIFNAWQRLCSRFKPIMIEKSPHHLHQKAALDLILEAKQKLASIDFLLIGLIRNPMDTLYSMWQRWRFVPEKHQHEWWYAYKNLLELKQNIGNELVIVRYEDMVTDVQSLLPVIRFINVASENLSKTFLHSNSVQKWKADKKFGFQLDPKIVSLAAQFGYDQVDIANDGKSNWPIYRYLYANPLVRAKREARAYLAKIVRRHRLKDEVTK